MNPVLSTNTNEAGKLNIIHISTEFAPFIKVGGLGDVIMGLSTAQAEKGHTVSVILPFYSSLSQDLLSSLKLHRDNLISFHRTTEIKNKVFYLKYHNVNLYFIAPDTTCDFFQRKSIYGYKDDITRFLYFSRSACEFLFKELCSPDIVHLHDWQTAIIPLLLKEIYQAHNFYIKKTLFTIHNIQYQGLAFPEDLSAIGLRGQDFLNKESLQDPHQKHLINLLKGGCNYSDAITTVSPTYAKEIQTSPGGFGLESTIIQNKNKLTGILNGLNINYWNPYNDSHLVAKYPSNPTFINTISENKEINKSHLLQQFNLSSQEKKPLISAISRLAYQKSPCLIKDALMYCHNQETPFILLGSPTSKEIEYEFDQLKQKFSFSPYIHIELSFNEDLAHRLYAGSDAIIIPSLFEPCGLVQLIAMRYATIPLVRKTGGLNDTVFDIDSQTANKQTGFIFSQANKQEMITSLERLCNLYSKPKQWKNLIKNAVNQDFSWQSSEKEYEKIYIKKTLSPNS